MHTILRGRRPSAALVVALLALVVALGGTSYAATKLPKNSVGTKQLKNNAVTTKKIKDGSLSAGDFAAGQLQSGPLAFGHVAKNGTVDSGKNLQFLGRGAGAVPVYCFNNTAGGATNVMVTVDSTADDPSYAQLGASTDPAFFSTQFHCPAGTDFMVSSDNLNPAALNAPVRGADNAFFVAVLG